MKIIRMAMIAAAVLGLGACTSSRMTAIPEPAVIAAPQPDKATVVFYRSSAFGGAVQSSVFDVTSDPPAFVGIVSSGMKLAYVVPPGQHRFMVIGESADFMDAQLLPKRTYYALVAPRVGVWKARFSLRPRAAGDDETQQQVASCKWYDNTPELAAMGAGDHARDHRAGAEIPARMAGEERRQAGAARRRRTLNPAHAAGRISATPSSSRAWMVVRTITRGSASGQDRPRCSVARLSHITTSPGRQRWR